MTLSRQLFLFIVLMLVVLFAGTLLVNINSTRDFLAQQLESHAQDTATSLGLSLSPYAARQDISAMDTMVGAIFDRGYYREISVASRDGKSIVERYLNIEIEGVPKWFIRLVSLDPPRVNANVMSGWQPTGAVHVQSHPGYAYRELWQTATRMLLWFAGLGAIAILLAVLSLRGILKPLTAVEQQAESLYARRYVIQEKIPRSRELRSVVLAMNRMTQRIRTTFEEQARTAEKLRQQAFLDLVTGLGNRRQFDNLLQNYLKSPRSPEYGALFVVRLPALQDINENQGYDKGDEFLRAAAAYLREATSENEAVVVARLSGADFGVLFPGAQLQEAERLGGLICDNLARLHSENFATTSHVLNVGVCMYTHEQEPSDVLAEADAALRVAQSRGPNAWYLNHEDAPAALHMGKQEWRTRLVDVIANKDIRLYVQSVVDASMPERLLHAEVLVRVPEHNDRVARAGEFMPVAEQFGLARDLDRIILTEGLDRLAEFVHAPAWAINMSPASLRDDTFISWMLNSLRRARSMQAKVVLEFSEFGAVRELGKLQTLVPKLRALGHGFAIDHFGRGLSPFGYLQSLQPDYVKIDGAYTAAIRHNYDNQFFVASLSNVAHSLDIKAIAKAVEDQEEWTVLRELHIDGVQGYAVDHPTPIEDWRAPTAG